MGTNFCQLWLTCADQEEADKIKNTLLAKHLVACVRQVPITSDFHWRSKIEHTNEVLLLMEGKLGLFDQIEAEITKLHSYDTFVLEAVQIQKISQKAKSWLKSELKNA